MGGASTFTRHLEPRVAAGEYLVTGLNYREFTTYESLNENHGSDVHYFDEIYDFYDFSMKVHVNR